MPKPPTQDEFTHLQVSHQRKTQLRYQRDGLCIICGKPLDGPSKVRCKKHQEMHNAHQRAKLGHKQWKPGSVGRPPSKLCQLQENNTQREKTNLLCPRAKADIVKDPTS